MENKPNIDQQFPTHYEEDEIDLIALAKTLWEGRKTIIKVTLTFMVLGLFMALLTPAQYTSSIVVKPILSDSKSKLGGSLGGLAAMAGINLGGTDSSSELHPTLYPQIVESYGLQKSLMQTKLQISGVDEPMTYENYFLNHLKPSFLQNVKKYTLGLPGLILSALKSDKEITADYSTNLTFMSKDDLRLVRLLSEQISIEINEKGGYVSLSATLPEAIASTQMVLHAQSLLQDAIIAHKAKKAKEDLSFIEERFAEKKAEFGKAQQKLAIYRDANRNVNTAIAQTEVQRLESEFALAFAVYSELAKQVETQKIQVKEDTPVFSVLQDAIVPLKKSGTNKRLILIIWTLFGGFMGLVLVFGKSILIDLRVKWNYNN
jgi:LPS O-antigen subunit length determinant protein (WzzB/FepE family)